MSTFAGKKAGNHSTLIEIAAKYVPLIAHLPEVKSISPGVIETGKGCGNGSYRVKICVEKGSVLLAFRQASSVQDVRIYSQHIQDATLAIARLLRNNRIPISFKKS